MHVVAVTRVWPNRFEPEHSAFNRQQFQALAALCDLEVIAAIPHVPGVRLLGRPRRLAKLATLPAHDVIAGIPTTNMRQYYLPKVDLPVAVPLWLHSLRPHREQLARADVVLATWAYPDACATILTAQRLGKPCVVKVHGSDLNVFARLPAAGFFLRRILPRAEALISVSHALTTILRGYGVAADRIHFVPNGVDAQLFQPRDRDEARHQLGVPARQRLAVFVGRLEAPKGIDELMAAFDEAAASQPALALALLGKGPAADRVRRWATPFGDRVRMLGERPHPEVARWLAACDLLVLPSWREGTPNVVLEAIASGRPVVATNVGGIPDIVAPEAGILVPPRDAAALARALREALERPWDADAIRATGPGSWQESAARVHAILEAAVLSRSSH